jgi:hypothetical protein
VRRLGLAFSGFLAIAGATAVATRADDGIAQADAARPAYLRSDELLRTVRGVTSNLRPVTNGMQPPTAQVHLEQVALTAPNITPPASTAKGEIESRPRDIVIDVLVAYTRNAEGHYSDIKRELIDVAIEGANKAFRLSNLGHIKLRMVHVYRTDYVEGGQHFDHVWRFADRGDGHMEEVHALRDLHRADLALLVVDDAKGCGLATRVQAEASEAFAVVHHACAAANYTVAYDAYPASLAQGNRLVTKVDRGVELIEAFSVVPILAPVS